MTNRTIRRAAEHAARKAAAKAAKQQQLEQTTITQPLAMAASAGATAAPSVSVDHMEPTPRTISEAKLNANRANSQKSTGPVTRDGRLKSSLNAVKTGLTGRTVLLSTEDAKAYQGHINLTFKIWAPATDQERNLVQMIADAEWRILRIPGLEAAIYAIGALKLADMHPEENDPAIREALIQGEVQLAYRRDLSNLALQERRLRSQHKSDIDKLFALQNDRLQMRIEKEKIQTSIKDSAGVGFEFSPSNKEHRKPADDDIPNVLISSRNLQNAA